ncbi:glycosyltransferase [Roseospira navarrensis]|uniref:Glycosyltransferase n=1 Tax=Roseospira navarrensis TaxID=140058 RepID=A0A7X1ZGP4_9PROT|nr:glycosyltransferase [Roseospira navarrensis]MQX38219.1 glycosyltransferase [Roseospira navarrensis]
MARDRTGRTTLVFLWSNFGPYHMDRLEAVGRHFVGRRRVLGLEMFPGHDLYGWTTGAAEAFEKRTLFAADAKPGVIGQLRGILRHLPPARDSVVYVSHYQRPAVLLLALWLRLRGGRVVMLGVSKFDDYPRSLWREVGKSLFLWPYHGALSSARRPRDYLRFLGIPADRIRGECNTVSLDRIRRQAGVPPAPDGPPHAVRHFTSIARLVPKKNHAVLLEAYRLYCDRVTAPRPLHLCGSGPLEADLRAQAEALGIADRVVFRGWVQDAEASRTLGTTLALLLPSVEEQFGNVVIEAQAMGLPVILSDNCGARDLLVRTAVNGYVVEPDNPRGLATVMTQLSEDEALWAAMCREATASAPLGDVARFVEGVEWFLDAEPVA